MKLFINSGVCKRMWNGNVKIRNLPDGKTKISIPNYLGEVREQEFINFILPSIAKKDLKKGSEADWGDFLSMETYIRINRKNKDEYISLSTLCK